MIGPFDMPHAIGLGDPPAAGDRESIGVRLGFTLGCNLTMLAEMFLGEWLCLESDQVVPARA